MCYQKYRQEKKKKKPCNLPTTQREKSVVTYWPRSVVFQTLLCTYVSKEKNVCNENDLTLCILFYKKIFLSFFKFKSIL